MQNYTEVLAQYVSNKSQPAESIDFTKNMRTKYYSFTVLTLDIFSLLNMQLFR